MRYAASGAKRKVPTPEPDTAIPVARALYKQETMELEARVGQTFNLCYTQLCGARAAK